MSSSSDVDQDPEAQRPPAPRGRACSPLPWALSAALLVFAAASAVCLVRSWTAPGAPAAPGPAPSPRLPEGPELTSDALAGFPDYPQVRCGPIRNPGETPVPPRDPFSI